MGSLGERISAIKRKAATVLRSATYNAQGLANYRLMLALRKQNKLLAEQTKLLKDLSWEVRQQRQNLEIQRTLMVQGIIADVEAFANARQLDLRATMEVLLNEKKSLARLGDGEMRIMLRPEFNLKFQPWSEGLSRELRDILVCYDHFSDTTLVGFPYLYRNLHWSGVWADIWNDVKPLLWSSKSMFGTSHVTRPLFFQRFGREGVDMWRQVWRGRSVGIITGRGSRFEMVDALFSNVGTVRWVESLPVNAYSDLERLKDELSGINDVELYLIALGPAGTLLAQWLASQGRWALDIGHLSDSYLNVFESGEWPESKGVLGKRAATG